jgi:predicted double-glycine peptidase
MILQDPNYSLCVPHTLHSILSMEGEFLTIEDATEACSTHKTRGTSHEGIVAGFAAYGYKFARLRFTVDDIRDQIRQGRPVVATYWTGEDAHFTEVTWANPDRGIEYVSLNDPLYGEIAFPMSIFKLLWKHEGSWARTVVKL